MPPSSSARLPVPDANARRGVAGTAEIRAARRALAAVREVATRARLHSQALRTRAAHAADAAAASRELTESHRALWQAWHRVWADLAGPGGPRIVRLCAYCGAAAAVGADPFSPASWQPVPPWVHDRLGAGSLGVRPSHGACPGCAEARLGG